MPRLIETKNSVMRALKVGLFLVAAIFVIVPVFAVQAQGGTVPPASSPPAAASAPAAVQPTSAQATPKSAPTSTTPTVKPQATSSPATIQPVGAPANQPPTVQVANTASAPPTPGKSNSKTIAFIIVGVAAVGALGAWAFRARKNDTTDNGDPCAAIKQQLEQKKTELNQTEKELSLKSALADKLKDEASYRAKEKLAYEAKDQVLERIGSGSLETVAGVAESGKEIYDVATDNWDAAKQLVEGLKAKCRKLQGEVKALESSYKTCMGTAGAGLAIGAADAISLRGGGRSKQKLILFGGAETDLGQAVPEIKLIGQTINRLKPKQVLHIPFARTTTNEVEWSGDWFNRNIILEGAVYLNAQNEADIAKANSPLIFISGGLEHANLYDKITSNPKLLKLIMDADCIIGESAGSAVLGEYRWSRQLDGPSQAMKGLGIVKNTVIVPHYTERNRQELLLQLMQETGVAYGMGIDSMTAIEFELDKFPGEYGIIGAGSVEIKKS